MENFNRSTDYSNFKTATVSKDKSLMVSTFAWMFAALVLSGVAAIAFSAVPSLTSLLFTVNEQGIGKPSIFFYVAAFSPLIISLVMNFGFNRLSYGALIGLFLGYSLLMGISLSVIFFVYSLPSIALVFALSAGIFGLMAFIGATTKADLSKMGTILMFAVIGIVVASLVNFFLQSSMLDFLVSIAGVVIFTGLAAYHTQNLKNMSEYNDGSVQMKKLGIISALTLYVTFINLFMFLLRLLGRRD